MGVPSTWRKSREAGAAGRGGPLHPAGACRLPSLPQTPTPGWLSLRKATWEQTSTGRLDAPRPFWSAPPRRSPWPGLFISCPPLVGSPVVYVQCGKEMTIKSLLWFGHSSWPPGSHKGLKEAQLQADTECKSLCRFVGEARPPPRFQAPRGWPGPRWDSVPWHGPWPYPVLPHCRHARAAKQMFLAGAFRP